MAVANWYPDPTDPSRVRWWDGTAWTEHTSAAPTPQPSGYAPSEGATAWGTSTDGGPASGAAPYVAASLGGSSAPAYRGQPQSSPFHPVPAAPAYGRQTYGGQRADELVVRRLDGKAYLPATALAAGVVPPRCTRHGKPAVDGLKTTHHSRLPGWVYLTILAGLLIFAVVAVAVRKSVVSRSWPFCGECLATRRRNLVLMAISLGLIVPVFWALANSSITDSGNLGIVLLVALLVLPVVALAFGGWASTAHLAGCEVTEDGLLVGIPVAAFSDDLSRVGAVRA
jgi:hypothetical protein